jgi:predicted restriction endonuclease
LDGKLDTAWSAAVRSVGCCEYCGRTDTLNAHHIYSRSKKSTRWDIENGICLCVAHHTFSSSFSAHKTPLEFIDWLYKNRGQDKIDALRLKSNQVGKFSKEEKEEMLKELQERANE